MLNSLLDPILPIFALLAVGYVVFRGGMFDLAMAQAINKFVFFVATPALGFLIIANAPVEQLEFPALAVYFCAQMIVYAGTAFIMRRFFHRDRGESLLLGMTVAFVNHVFFILPIAERLYGDAATIPIAGIVLVDGVIVFCASVIAVELLQAENLSPLKVTRILLTNPFVIATSLGILTWYIRPVVPDGLFTYAEFAGGAAAPAALFALGIVLASRSIFPLDGATLVVVLMKLVLHPALVLALAASVTLSPNWKDTVLLVAAGPCGAMPFVIAMQYGIRTETIAKAVLISTLASVFSLSFLTG